MDLRAYIRVETVPFDVNTSDRNRGLKSDVFMLKEAMCIGVEWYIVPIRIIAPVVIISWMPLM